MEPEASTSSSMARPQCFDSLAVPQQRSQVCDNSRQRQWQLQQQLQWLQYLALTSCRRQHGSRGAALLVSAMLTHLQQLGLKVQERRRCYCGLGQGANFGEAAWPRPY